MDEITDEFTSKFTNKLGAKSVFNSRMKLRPIQSSIHVRLHVQIANQSGAKSVFDSWTKLRTIQSSIHVRLHVRLPANWVPSLTEGFADNWALSGKEITKLK